MGLLSIPYQSKSKLWIAIFLVVWSLISMHFIWQSQANSGLILKNELSLTSSIPHEFEMLIDTNYPKFKPTLGHSGSQTYLNLFKNQDPTFETYWLSTLERVVPNVAVQTMA